MRKTKERRKSSSFTTFKYFISGRGNRTHNRRISEEPHYTDKLPFHLSMMCVIIILLSTIDSFNTSFILYNGGQELNLFAQILINNGIWYFVFTKFFLTSLGIILLLIHYNHKLCNIAVEVHIYIIYMIYIMLLLYELILIVK